MTNEELTEDEVYKRFTEAVKAIGGQRDFARMVKLTPSYINDIFHKRRAISAAVCAQLGIERIETVRYFYVGVAPQEEAKQ